MGTKILGEGAEKVYNAAQEWVEQALRRDGSLFTPGEKIWSREWLGQLHRRFLNNPDESRTSFDEKLRRQLDGSPPEVYQLMGEVLYFHYLITDSITLSTKQNGINRVLNWSPTPVKITQDLINSLAPGILNPGTFFNTSRPFQVGFLIEFMEQWKDQSPTHQRWLLEHPWEFKNFATELNLASKLFQSSSPTTHPQQAALLHLVFPDFFEAIVSAYHKEKIAKAFGEFVTAPEEDIDRQLTQIRQGLEALFESRDHFFYIPHMRVQWDDDYKPTDSQLEKDQLPPHDDQDPNPPVTCDDPWSPTNITTLAQDILWQPHYLQEIIEDLQEKRQVIFYGPPGTGKTYVAREIANQCKLNGGDFEIVQFHPSYSYEDFVQGFRPKLINGQPGFDLVDGPLRRIADKAKKNREATYILIIDELNRGNVAKVFGELYFLLEYRNEEVRLQYGGDGEGFSLPDNLWFICTMNTADRSIALMDAALRRRFYFAPFFPNEPPIAGLLRRWLKRENQDTLAADLVDAANKKLERDMGVGPSYFMRAGQTLDEDRVRRIWGRAVIPYIEEQFFGDEDKLAEFAFDRLKRQLTSPTTMAESFDQATVNEATNALPVNDDTDNTC